MYIHILYTFVDVTGVEEFYSNKYEDASHKLIYGFII